MKTLNIKKIIIVLVLVLIGMTNSYSQYILTVTKTSDPDPFLYFANPDAPEIVGTLQWAIRKANDAATPCVIEFAIAGGGQQVIYLNYELPMLTNTVTIDGTTQANYIKGVPVIEINGQSNIGTAIQCNGVNSVVKGLKITNFIYQALFIPYTSNFEISSNVICSINNNETAGAFAIRTLNTTGGKINGNYIGTDINNNVLTIGDWGIFFQNTDNCTIGGNNIDDKNIIANCNIGIISLYSNFNQFIQNAIYNTTEGLRFNEGISNKISQNIFYNNTKAISLTGSANNTIQPPVITTYSDNNISGTSQPNDIIEIFGSTGSENANEYLGSATADGSGNWTATVASNSWEYVVATATDDGGNSSTFSTKSINFCYSICLLPDQENSPISYPPYPPLEDCNSEEICLGESVTFQIARVCSTNEFFAYFEFKGAYTDDTYTLDYVGTDGYYNIFQFTFTPTQAGTFDVIPHVGQDGPYNLAGHFNLIVNPGPIFYIDGNTTFCEGSSTTLTALGSTSYSYLWSNGSTTQSTTVTEPGVYSVTATSANGCTKTESIEVFQDPSPDITISGNTNICQGQSTTLTATGGYSYYHWSNGINSSAITVSQPGTYTVTVTNEYGCTSTASLTVIQNPSLNITISGNNNICYGSYTTLAATSGYSNYLWSNGLTSQSISINPFVNTNYSVTVTSTQGCTGSSTIAVTVNALPTASITPATSTICTGFTATLTASNGASYLWSTGAITASITVNPSTTTTYTVTITNAAGCTATASRTVTVNALPTASITPTTSTICADASATLTAYGGGTYLWSSNSATTASITVSPTSTTTYTVTVTSAAGCKATASRTVSVNALPTADITGNTTICSGASTQLTATGGTSYTWSTGSINPIINVSPSSSTTYTVTVTNANGCSATDNILVNVNIVNISTSPPNPQVCAGSSITLIASGGINYIWSTGATTSSITVSPATNASYFVTVTDANGCTGDSKANVTVIPVPTIVLESTNAICDNNGTATVSSVIGTPPVTYLWSNGSNTQSITALAMGTYTVTVTDVGGCNATGSVTVTYDCCDLDCDIYLEDGDNANDLMAQNGGSTTVNYKKICINGTFTVSDDYTIGNIAMVTFNKCTVKMGDDAIIYITKGSFLVIDNTIVKACNNKLWNMILVDNGDAKVIVRNNSIISDGKDAIMSDYEGKFQIDNSSFKKNINAVHVKNWVKQSPPGTITKTLFSGGTLINQTQAQKGVYLEKGLGFIFGEKNIYEYLQYGIYARNVVRVLSQYKSNFKNNFTALDYRNISTQNSSSLQLNNADINVCTNGVVTQYVKSQVHIKLNKFNFISNNAIEITDNRNCDVSYNSQMNKIGGTAIKVQNVNIGSVNQTISNNVITNTKNGIQAINLEAVNISYNNISIKAQQSANSYNNGISLEGCKTMTVNNNTVNGNNVWAWWQRGINSQNSTASLISTNTINGAGKSIEFGGNSTNGKMQCNTMNNAGNGLFLAYSWGLPPQGDPSSCTVNDNQWTGTFGEGHTHCYYSFGQYSPFYVRYNSGANYIPTINLAVPLFNGVPNPQYTSVISTNGDNSGCSTILSPCSSNKSGSVNNYDYELQIATNNVEYNINAEENRWLAHYYVYSKLMTELEMLDFVEFVNFRDSITNTNIAKIYEFNTLLNDTALDSTFYPILQTINNSIASLNTIEYNHKRVNDILLQSFANDNILYNSKSELIGIAEQCPYTSGNAVFSARVLLSQIDTVLYTNECESVGFNSNKSQLLSDNKDYNITSDKYKIYPNPSNNIINIELFNVNENIVAFELYDILGKKIYSSVLTEIKNKIDITSLKQGVYHYKIDIDNSTFSGKIIVIQ